MQEEVGRPGFRGARQRSPFDEPFRRRGGAPELKRRRGSTSGQSDLSNRSSSTASGSDRVCGGMVLPLRLPDGETSVTSAPRSGSSSPGGRRLSVASQMSIPNEDDSPRLHARPRRSSIVSAGSKDSWFSLGSNEAKLRRISRLAPRRSSVSSLGSTGRRLAGAVRRDRRPSLSPSETSGGPHYYSSASRRWSQGSSELRMRSNASWDSHLSVNTPDLWDSLDGDLTEKASRASAARAKERDAMKRWMRAVVESNVFSASMFILSVWALFGDDVRAAGFEKSADNIFNFVTIFSIFVFSTEIALSSVVVHDYFLSFFFLLDIVATVSLILDLTWVWHYLIGYESFTSSKASDGVEDSGYGQSEYARAGRSSRVGTRVARILRVFRLIRMVRVFSLLGRVKNFDLCASRKRDNDLGARPGHGGAFGTEPGEHSEESLVGRKLSDRTTLSVICLVLAMLVVVPLLDPGDYVDMTISSAQYGADVIHQAWEDYIVAVQNGVQGAARQELLFAWERQVLYYTYYHNFYATCPGAVHNDADCAASLLYKICFLGFVSSSSAGLTWELSDWRLRTADWSSLFHGRPPSDWRRMLYVVGELPGDILDRLRRPWVAGCREPGSEIHGVSLVRDVPCPWRTWRVQETTWYLGRRRGGLHAGSPRMVFFFDMRDRVRWEATMSIIQTVFIVIVLCIGALMFSKDTDNLVLHPIERMISKVEIIRRHPLYAICLEDQQNRDGEGMSDLVPKKLRNSVNNAVQWGRSSVIHLTSNPAQSRSSSYLGFSSQTMPCELKSRRAKKVATLETKILENTIIKLGSLLALGFGEAGTEIIGKNLDDDSVMIDVAIPGCTVEAIYGFCEIKDFATTTEVLQERTMVFVNQVAALVHRIVDEHLGAANKNVGEAFLLVWRVGQHKADLRAKIADLSVMSFIQVVVAVNRDACLAEYREHPALIARYGAYRVSLGFGLHIGWSIEGAIGSDFKIDASYLSSHVNMAVSIEAVTTQYGAVILLSEPLVRTCSQAIAYHFRAIDYVKLSGAKEPMHLFSVDLDINGLFVDRRVRPRAKPLNRYRERQQRDVLKREKMRDAYDPGQVFGSDRNIARMRQIYYLGFFQAFEKGYLNYEAGEWHVAAKVFEVTAHMLANRSCQDMAKVDGPSCALLDYMRGFGFQAPAGWTGYREIAGRSRGGLCEGAVASRTSGGGSGGLACCDVGTAVEGHVSLSMITPSVVPTVVDHVSPRRPSTSSLLCCVH